MKFLETFKKRSFAIKLAAGVLILSAAVFGSTVSAAFSDVNPGDWYYSDVEYISSSQIMTGMSDTYFGVSENLARAQFALILYRMEGQPAVSYSAVFPDVSPNEWYTDAILWASEAGIVTGFTDTGTFRPSEPITREQMAAMMYRYTGYKGGNLNERAELSIYPDNMNVSSYAYESMQWAVANQIIRGDNGLLCPQDNTNRAVCATIIARYLRSGLIEGGDQTPPQAVDGELVIKYAEQFLGNPYKYGGTSLTEGADCSGFVMAVYQHFNIKLGRTTQEQEKAGVEVSVSEMLPGDIIVFEGEHVGIYCGDGMMIHAATVEDGICKEKYIYMGKVKTIRRIV